MNQQQSYWFGTLYLIHFDHRLQNPNGHGPRHYLGFVENGGLDDRIRLHRSGQGSRLLLAVTQAGIQWRVVLTLPGDRNTERRLKKHRNLPRYCPICNPDHWRTGWTDRRGRRSRQEALPSGDVKTLESGDPEGRNR